MNDKIDRLHLYELVNVLTDLNNLKAEVDDLDVGNLETVAIELKKLKGAVSEEGGKKDSAKQKTTATGANCRIRPIWRILSLRRIAMEFLLCFSVVQ